jgi:hypothetical protein
MPGPTHSVGSRRADAKDKDAGADDSDGKETAPDAAAHDPHVSSDRTGIIVASTSCVSSIVRPHRCAP